MILDRFGEWFGGWREWYWAMTDSQRLLLWSDVGIIVCVGVAAVLVLGVQRSLRLSGVVALLGLAYTLHAARPGGSGDGPLGALSRVWSQPTPKPTAAMDRGLWERMAGWIWTNDK
jgi:hypothetical protein